MRYWAQAPKPSFGARFGQILQGGLQGLGNFLATKHQLEQQKHAEAEERRKEAIARMQAKTARIEAQKKYEEVEKPYKLAQTEKLKQDALFTQAKNEYFKKHGRLPADANDWAQAMWLMAGVGLRGAQKEQIEAETHWITPPPESELPSQGGLGLDRPIQPQTFRDVPQTTITQKFNPSTWKSNVQTILNKANKTNITEQEKERLGNQILVIAENFVAYYVSKGWTKERARQQAITELKAMGVDLGTE